MNELMSIVYMIPILLFSIAVHECAHAYVAYKLGDRFQKVQGRMTLNPFAHFDIFGFISLLLIKIGWGKPVMVDDSNFKNKNRDNMLVALAGPVSNLLLAVLFTIIFKILIMSGIPLNSTGIVGILLDLVYLSIQYNIVLAIFNLLPIQPFDGSKVVRYFLPYKWKMKYDELEKFTFYIVLILAFTGIAGMIISPVVNWISNLLNMFIML